MRGKRFFVMPNAWDVGSAVRLEGMGFEAIATTSSGHALSLGRVDGEVDFAELCRHVESLASAVDIPVSVDSERLSSATTDGIGRSVDALAAGAAGISIEDLDPATSALAPPLVVLADLGVRRVSTGGRLARVGYDAMEAEAATLQMEIASPGASD